MRAEAKKPIKSRKTGAKLYASTVLKRLVAHLSSPNVSFGFYRNAKALPGNRRGFSVYVAILEWKDGVSIFASPSRGLSWEHFCSQQASNAPRWTAMVASTSPIWVKTAARILSSSVERPCARLMAAAVVTVASSSGQSILSPLIHHMAFLEIRDGNMEKFLLRYTKRAQRFAALFSHLPLF